MISRTIHSAPAVLALAVAAFLCLPGFSQADTRDDIARQNLSKRLNEYANELEKWWASYKLHVENVISRNDENALSCIFRGAEIAACQFDADASLYHYGIFSNLLRDYDKALRLEGVKARLFLSDKSKSVTVLAFAQNRTHLDDYRERLECIDKGVKERIAIIRNVSSGRNFSVKQVSSVLDPLNINVGRCSPSRGAGAVPFTVGPTVPLIVNFNAQCTTEDVVEKDGAAKPYQPTTAALLYDKVNAGPQAICTGTLIAPNAVLTAAHCFCLTSSKDPSGRFFSSYATCQRGFYRRQTEWVRALDPAHHLVYLQHAGVFEIDRVILHPDFRWTDALPRADLAVMILKSNVPGIDPALLADRPVLQPGMTGTSVGYGFSNPIGTDGRPINFTVINEKTGIKLMGRVAPTSCSTGERLRKLICWDYRLHDGITPLTSTCNGDSGGPLFMDHDEKTFLVGVTTAGSATCQPGTRAYDMDAYLFSPWIRRVTSQNPPATQTVNRQNPRQLACQYCPLCGISDAGRGTSFAIPPIKKGISLLRVSVNCTETNQFLKVSLTRAARTSGENPPVIVCGGAGKTSIASCETEVRERDAWSAKIETQFPRACQIVATGFN